MQISRRALSNNLIKSVDCAKQEVKQKYSLTPGNNVYLICDKLAELPSTSGIYIECGVFQGNTLFTIATFLKHSSDNRLCYGFDSFQGFPQKQIDKEDHPNFFSTLFEKGLISEEHYKKAAERTKNFKDKSHLTKEYFLDIKKVFDIAKDFENVRLAKGLFKNTLRNMTEPIAVLFLDCDLYQSYRECLKGLYSFVVPGGVIIFDEYYSLKYPGPRLAVNEFFKDKRGYFEVYCTEEGFERWCFVKSK